MTHSKPQDEWRDRLEPIAEDMRFQRLSWRVQAAGWIALSLVAVAALLGLFSDGPLSWTRAQAARGNLVVDYQRVYRSGLDSWIDIRIAGKAGEPERELVLSPELLEPMTLKSAWPEPLRSAAGPDGLHLFFALPAEGVGSIRLSFRPQAPAGVDGTIALVGAGEPARLGFLILP